VKRGELTSELAAQLGARHEARFIIEDVLGLSAGATAGAGSGAEDTLTAEQVEQAHQLAQRRSRGEPLQYVLGHWAFRHLDLLVDPRVLIPRPETEQVVEVALSEAAALGPGVGSGPLTVVDAGTGSGAIALSLATELAGPDDAGALYAIDASADALAVARANHQRVQAATAQSGQAMWPVTFLHGSWLAPLPPEARGVINLVVSNPPYVAEAEWPELEDEVKTEPRQALVAGAGSDGTPGLADVESVLRHSLHWLARPGAVVIELAPHQADAAGRMAAALGYLEVELRDDLAGRPRALIGRVW
jgi:release factor glutamine methyltransferase